MNLIKMLFGEAREGGYHPSAIPPQWMLGGALPSAAGVVVNEDTAQSLAVVNSCVKVLADATSQIPLKVFLEADDETKTPAKNHKYYKLLNLRPNRYMTSSEWRRVMMRHLLIRGNAYSEVVYNGAGEAVALLPRNPANIAPHIKPTGELVYIHLTNGGAREISSAAMVHIKGPSDDGILGKSPITCAAETFGLAIAAERASSSFFANDSVPAGFLKTKKPMSKEASQKFMEAFRSNFGGANKGKTALLNDDMEWVQISLSARDSEFLASRVFSDRQIAGMFGVPLHMIGDLERATFSNIEHLSLEFVMFKLMPHLIHFEQALEVTLFDGDTNAGFSPKFVVEGLLRGDYKTRQEGHSIGVQGGWIKRNEVRKIEGLPKEPGLDEFLYPLNMGPASKLGENQDSITPARGARGADASVAAAAGDLAPTEPNIAPRTVDRTFTLLFDGELSRSLRREIKSLKAAILKPNFSTTVEEIYERHSEIMIENLTPIALGYANLLGQTDASARSAVDRFANWYRTQRLVRFQVFGASMDEIAKWESEGVAEHINELMKAITKGEDDDD